MKGFIFKAEDEKYVQRILDHALVSDANLLEMGKQTFEKISKYGITF